MPHRCGHSARADTARATATTGVAGLPRPARRDTRRPPSCCAGLPETRRSRADCVCPDRPARLADPADRTRHRHTADCWHRSCARSRRSIVCCRTPAMPSKCRDSGHCRCPAPSSARRAPCRETQRSPAVARTRSRHRTASPASPRWPSDSPARWSGTTPARRRPGGHRVALAAPPWRVRHRSWRCCRRTWRRPRRCRRRPPAAAFR